MFYRYFGATLLANRYGMYKNYIERYSDGQVWTAEKSLRYAYMQNRRILGFHWQR